MATPITTVVTRGGLEDIDGQMELLMRHSSPIVRPGQAAVASPLLLAERNSSPSPLRMHRPRSNPRNRTPMRFESPLQSYRIREEEQDGTQETQLQEARRITIRPMAGRAVGTTVLTTQIHEEGTRNRPLVKSRKQGPSHRKIRRWNNDNFVNLAAEINSNKGGKTAAQVLLRGYADATKYRSVYDPNEQHLKSKAMKEFRNDKNLSEQFFEGTLIEKPRLSRDVKLEPSGPLTPEIMLNRIDARLRRVVVKACVNSYPASKVVNTLEKFLIRAYQGKKDKTTREEWDEILVEPPTVTHHKRTEMYVTKFLFDAESPTGGFHRLLLHGLCQFHGLKAVSSTLDLCLDGKSPHQARLLTASGSFSGAEVRMVDYITQQHSE